MMAHSNVHRPEKRQRCDEDDGGGGDSGHDDDGAAAIVVASPEDAARRVARALEDAVLFRIAEFLDPGKAAVVCKGFFEAATKTSESFLNGIEKKHCVDPEWRLRLAQRVLDSYKRFYFGDDDTGAAAANQHPTPRLNPTLHPRLLHQSALQVPLMHRGELVVFDRSK